MIELILFAVSAFVIVGVLLSTMIVYAKKGLVSTEPCRIGINRDDKLAKFTEAGKSLLWALADEGISLPSPCGGKATCRQCKVQVIKGGGEVLETDRASFSPKELRQGWRLACQCKVKDDLEIEVPTHLLSLRAFQATVVSNENVATFIKELVVKVPDSELIEYIPGDYLQFHVPSFETDTGKWKETMDEKYYVDWDRLHLFDIPISFDASEDEVVRAYSMASYPAEKGVLKFNVRIATPPLVKGALLKGVSWGICSSYIYQLKPGDQVRLSGPFGESHMIEDERELIFLIGGAGASFGRSHILDLFRTKQTKRKVTLWYGARSLKENIYQEEYERLEKEFKNFYYKLVLSEPSEQDFQQGWPKDDPCKTNYLFKAFEEGQLKKMEEPECCLYYICGPPLHNKSIMNLLDQYGVPPEHIILDDFGS
jgi:Na+-transporting NADH:ubiquinone oxidoreductase subunit F